MDILSTLLWAIAMNIRRNRQQRRIYHGQASSISKLARRAVGDGVFRLRRLGAVRGLLLDGLLGGGSGGPGTGRWGNCRGGPHAVRRALLEKERVDEALRALEAGALSGGRRHERGGGRRLVVPRLRCHPHCGEGVPEELLGLRLVEPHVDLVLLYLHESDTGSNSLERRERTMTNASGPKPQTIP